MARPRRREDEQADEVPITIRFPRDLRDTAVALAEQDDRSFNLYVVRAVRAQVERDQAKRKAAR